MFKGFGNSFKDGKICLSDLQKMFLINSIYSFILLPILTVIAIQSINTHFIKNFIYIQIFFLLIYYSLYFV